MFHLTMKEIMKKYLLTAMVALMSLTASAQVYVGGELGFWRNPDANTTQFQLSPEIGYNLSQDWALGLNLSYAYNYRNGVDANTVAVAPYARYSYAQWGPVRLFVDGGFGFKSIKIDDADAVNGWEIGLRPGLSVSVTDKLNFISHVGFLGYRDTEEIGGEGHGFGFFLSGQELTFGIQYNF